MSILFKKLNAFLLERPKLLLTLMWVFFFLAFIPAVYITLTNPTMGFLRFLSCIIVQAAICLYLRLLYSRVQDKKRAERRAEREAANEVRHPHKKKKK